MPPKVQTGEGRLQRREGTLQRLVSSIARLFGRGRKVGDAPRARRESTSHPARPVHRESDIPMEQLAAMYTPTQTSLKGPLRASGDDRERDQEFAGGVGDDRWNDEDRLTNKSGDPRIGTHGRTYEPGEARTAHSTTEHNS